MGEADLLRIRLSPRYRAAIWLARAGNVIVLLLLAWVLLKNPPVEVLGLGWLLGVATLGPAVWLLYTVLPGVRRGRTWTAEPDAGRAVLRDVVLPKPKA